MRHFQCFCRIRVFVQIPPSLVWFNKAFYLLTSLRYSYLLLLPKQSLIFFWNLTCWPWKNCNVFLNNFFYFPFSISFRSLIYSLRLSWTISTIWHVIGQFLVHIIWKNTSVPGLNMIRTQRKFWLIFARFSYDKTSSILNPYLFAADLYSLSAI